MPALPDSLAALLPGELAFALTLADLADAETLPRYTAKRFTVDRKRDRSEVTEADRNAEAAISAAVRHERPEHAVFGEEHGLVGAPDSRWRWIIDPVDGTSNFVRGIPVWASLIALTFDYEVVVGVVSCPSMQRRWSAARGLGAHVNGHTIRVSTIDRLSDAQVCITHSSGWDALGLTDQLVSLQQRAYRSRGFGDFWQHMLVAEGAVELAVDAVGLRPYDLAAVQVIVEEAGGRFTDRLGERTYRNDTAVSSNGRVPHPRFARGDE